MRTISSAICLAGAMTGLAVSAALADGHGGFYDPVEDMGVVGNIEASYRASDIEDIDPRANFWALRGTLNLRDGGYPQVQIDVGYERARLDDLNVDALDGAVHLYQYATPNIAYGAFIQGARFTTNLFDLLGMPDEDDSATDVVGGLQVAYLGDLGTVYGQVGYGVAEYDGDSYERYAAKAGVRAYATDNFRFDVEGAFNRLDGDDWGVNAYTLAAQGNYRIRSSPVSVFARYEYDRFTYDESDVQLGDLDVQTISAGVKMHFGSTSLREEERNGPQWSANRAYY
ncbi:MULTISPECIES: hypothetical protein [unclassified Roseitalea]|uniref:hypothetical protein n=1 Tax=unclassified Roseitalea TaxID=2639107 RepID=UPI00273D4EAE|nr:MULTISPECIES: hypothetical protein [unclassified Roseitalea]